MTLVHQRKEHTPGFGYGYDLFLMVTFLYSSCQCALTRGLLTGTESATDKRESTGLAQRGKEHISEKERDRQAERQRVLLILSVLYSVHSSYSPVNILPTLLYTSFFIFLACTALALLFGIKSIHSQKKRASLVKAGVYTDPMLGDSSGLISAEHSKVDGKEKK